MQWKSQAQNNLQWTTKYLEKEFLESFFEGVVWSHTKQCLGIHHKQGKSLTTNITNPNTISQTQGEKF